MHEFNVTPDTRPWPRVERGEAATETVAAGLHHGVITRAVHTYGELDRCWRERGAPDLPPRLPPLPLECRGEVKLKPIHEARVVAYPDTVGPQHQRVLDATKADREGAGAGIGGVAVCCCCCSWGLALGSSPEPCSGKGDGAREPGDARVLVVLRRSAVSMPLQNVCACVRMRVRVCVCACVRVCVCVCARVQRVSDWAVYI